MAVIVNITHTHTVVDIADAVRFVKVSFFVIVVGIFSIAAIVRWYSFVSRTTSSDEIFGVDIVGVFVNQIDAQPQTLQFLHQNIKAFWQLRAGDDVMLDN